jgi:hypothetical protein
MHTDLLAPPAEGRRRQCPCGAVTEHSYHLCRKCRARIVWRRKTTRTNRRMARRLAARQARAGARTFAIAIRTVKKGVDN